MSSVRSIACADLAVEARYLGAVLLRAEALESAPVAVLDFVSPAHQAIFAAMLSIRGRGEEITTLAVQIELQRTGRLVSVGIDRLLALTSTLELDPHACARRLRELAALRRVRDASLRAVQLVDAGELDEARHELARVALEEAGSDEDPVIGFRPMLIETLEALVSARTSNAYVTLGTEALDDVYLAGPGDLVVVGASTGTGKSSLLTTWALSLAKRGVGVGVISIEDKRTDYGSKALAAISGVPTEALWKGAVSEEQADAMLRAIDRDGDLPISIVKIRSRGVQSVVSRMAYMARVRGVRVVLVDYLQAIRHRDIGSSTRERVNDTLAALLAAAAQLDVVLVLASQLRRTDGSKFHEPHDGELKESGDIENSAQCIVLLWRETDDENDPRFGIVYGKIAKVKQVATGRRFWMRRGSDAVLREQLGRPPEGKPGGWRR
jgi:replicative DNA helicase